jgi:hypothetical protein
MVRLPNVHRQADLAHVILASHLVGGGADVLDCYQGQT